MKYMMDFGEDAVNVYSFQKNESVVIINDDGDLSETKVRVMLLICGIILIPLFCLLGSIGNILSLCVLFHKRMRNRVNYVLAALCISDTLFLIHSLIYTGLNIYRKFKPDEGDSLRAHVYPVVGAYGSVVTARITSCLTLLLCAERFVAVYFPMRARGICNTRNTCFCVVLIYLITLILFIPLSLKYEAKEIAFNYTTLKSCKTIMIRTEFYSNNVDFFTFYGMSLNIVFRFVPLVMITILNALMIRILHKSWKKRIEMSKLDQKCDKKLSVKDAAERRRIYTNVQHHVTKMLLTVSFVFSICILPGALNSIASHIWPDYSRLGGKKNLFTFISAITFLLETINSSVNFIIYMALSRKFRVLYKKRFCCGLGEVLTQFSVSSLRGRVRRSSHLKSSVKVKRPTEGGSRISQSDTNLNERISVENDNTYHTSGLDKSFKVKVLAKRFDRNTCMLKPNGRMSLKCSNSYCAGDIHSVKKRLVHSASDPYGMIANPRFYICSKDEPVKESLVKTMYEL